MFLIFLLVILSLVVFFLRRRSTKDGVCPPPYPGALPLIGHAHLAIGSKEYVWKVLEEVSSDAVRRGGVNCIYLGLQTHYFIADPGDSMTVANKCLDKPYYYHFGKPWYGTGLFTSEGLMWKQHRKLLSPVFNQLMLNGFIGIFNKQAKKLMSQLSADVDQKPYVNQDLLARNILEAVTQATLNFKDDQHHLTEEYIEASLQVFGVITSRSQKIWMHNSLIYSWTALKGVQNKLVHSMSKVSNYVIQNRKKERKQIKNGEMEENIKTDKLKPLLDVLLDLEDEEKFTEKDVKDELNTLVVAAFDTTSITLCNTLMLLGSHKDVQDRVYKEIQQVLGNLDRDVDKDDLAKLVYLEAVVKESVRLHPPAPFIGRRLTENVKLKNYTLSKGDSCVISLIGLNKHPVWGADAEQFKPERWLDPTTLPDVSNVFASFSIGKRACIGKSFALMLLKTILVHLLRKFRVTADISKLVVRFEIFLRPTSGHEIKLEPRV